MTRKDWEKIEWVLKKAKEVARFQELSGTIPEIPSAEWMRKYIIRSICVEFSMKKEQDDAFCKASGLYDRINQTAPGRIGANDNEKTSRGI